MLLEVMAEAEASCSLIFAASRLGLQSLVRGASIFGVLQSLV